MTNSDINTKAALLLRLSREMEKLKEYHSEIRKQLIAEAKKRKADHRKTDGGGRSWEFAMESGELLRVTWPASKLRGEIAEHTEAYEQIMEICEGSHVLLFDSHEVLCPCASFSDALSKEENFDEDDRKAILKIMTSKSSPQLSFEARKTQEGGGE